MNLLILTQAVDQDDPVLGFFHRWIEKLAPHMEHVEVICLREGKHALPSNVRVHTLGKPRGETRSLGFLARMRYTWRFYRLAFALRARYQTVFVHMNAEYVALAGLFWRLAGKYVALWYNHPDHPLALRVAARFANRLFYTSPYAASAGYAHAHRMPAGIDTDIFSARPVPRDRTALYMQGRITPGKRVDVALDALTIVRQEVPATLTIVGPEDPGYGDILRAQFADLVAADAARFIGTRRNDDTPPLMSGAGVAINLAAAGHFDKTALEPMACETPVVVGSPAFAGLVPAEWVVPERDPAALAQAILRIIRLPEAEYAALGKSLRAAVVREQSLDILIERLVVELE
ncbi:MAG TPA: glycosyltransferase family 4 protein [Candidatus Paceibacterota bacterium]|nr:glycosyltransferase family 4 protein [Candidatus Paceibacterota bacterium]